MTERIDNMFSSLKKSGKAGLIAYIMANDPDYQTSLEILTELPKSGVDLIELGMPFSDPMAEGPIIQAAARRALQAEGSVKNTIEMVASFRKQNNETPIILMGYYNPIHHYGVEAFIEDTKIAGVDGFIIVDLPTEEEKEFTQFAYPAGLALIKLSAPTTDEARAKTVYENARGFAYYVSIAGVTGTKTPDFDAVETHTQIIRNATALPIAVGFGIKTPEHAAKVANFADAVVVGSEFCRRIEENLDNKVELKKEVLGFAKELSQNIKL